MTTEITTWADVLSVLLARSPEELDTPCIVSVLDRSYEKINTIEVLTDDIVTDAEGVYYRKDVTPEFLPDMYVIMPKGSIMLVSNGEPFFKEM